MESISEMLQGFQASLLPEVERYWVENARFAPEHDRLTSSVCTPEQPQRQRRREPSGWIEERISFGQCLCETFPYRW
ncbi:hypothetical protein H6F43_02130 [Leptolyngbya sp. FACHB-36]|uniref:hypothetical protein n=1 Tax=Leptolyngbya sp. FACHB-36 TaxID=2692808 RepID=UPI00167FF7B2|nr:hypothetical protein [Leptolyngbya sp. FACHB-36]MBD2018984.1 hypothetical protein [Leptolyngbya sp. FACHB-36]